MLSRFLGSSDESSDNGRVTCYMGDTLLSNCRVQAPGKLLWLRAVCRWEPERARAKPR